MQEKLCTLLTSAKRIRA